MKEAALGSREQDIVFPSPMAKKEISHPYSQSAHDFSQATEIFSHGSEERGKTSKRRDSPLNGKTACTKMGNYDKEYFSPSPRGRGRRARHPEATSSIRATLQVVASIIGLIAITVAYKSVLESSKFKRATKNYQWPRSTDETIMASFLDDYKRIMTGYDRDDEYFASVNVATEQIQKMFAAIPSPPSAQEVRAFSDMQRSIERRAQQIKFAYDGWEKVVKARESVMYEILNPEEEWRVYLDEQPIDEAKAAEVSGSWVAMTRKFGVPEPTACVGGLGNLTKPSVNINVDDNGKAEWEDREEFYEQNMALVAEAGSQITNELDRLYTKLFEDWNWDSALSHLREAWRTEEGFIKNLRSKSPKGYMWSNCHPISLRTLVERMEGIHRGHVNIYRTLQWLKAHFPHKEPKIIQDPAEWLGSAKELFRQWYVLGNATEEGILMMLRRRDVRLQWRRTYAEASWADWKSRNCGGTSCYEVDANDGKLFLHGKPVAAVAADEAEWVKTIEGNGTRISREKYEEACCAKRQLGHRLKHNSNSPKEMNLNI
ncbi:hypothetical protein F5Y03DRAFT_153256 [Xylaria venustula]|nr:hypothetical protein F5Y03DRAFT_153256 [Xylaria venustula]